MIIYRWVSNDRAPQILLPDTTAFDALLTSHTTQTYVVDIRLVDAAEMQAINLQYRQVDQSTDIISFPLYESISALPSTDAPLGDLVICAAMMDTDHLSGSEIVVHGVLHLLGFYHETDSLSWNTARQQVITPNVETSA